MRKILTLFIIVSFFLQGCVSTQKPEAQFQNLIDSIYTANPASVGIMVHVEAPQQGISWSGASGHAKKDAQAELEADQPALIASNIKTYVAATILKLVEEKRLSVESPVKDLLTEKTRTIFENAGYDLEAIRVKHLLSHTSGIQNYANMGYIEFIDKHKTYRWTRDEQLERTISTGPPLGPPAMLFNYTDANYLLLTEIIENITHQPFYTAMRDLLNYEKLGLAHTWFPTLEEQPAGTKPVVYQYWGRYNWDSNDIDVSIDLYGGGGIACPPKDLAVFIYKLFNAEIIEDTNVLNLIYTEIKTDVPAPGPYYFGLWAFEYQGIKGYGHSGFWGTMAVYFPESEASVAVYILEKDKSDLRDIIISRIITSLEKKSK